MGGKLINIVDVSVLEVSNFPGQWNELFFFSYYGKNATIGCIALLFLQQTSCP
jgi:hypothetical protein